MSDIQNANPLQKHFRRPAIYLKLPSQGKFWPDGAINIPASGELPVLPMTTKDEITIRTPDALLNGAGVVDVIKSCIPTIVDPWKMPSVDVDSALIAIRIASYTNMMDVDTKCPHCVAENSYQVDLNNILATVKCPDYSKELIVENAVPDETLTFKFRPQFYFEVNKANLIEFEEEKVLNVIKDITLDEQEKTKQFSEHLARLVDLNNQIYVDSTEYIQLSDGTKVTSSAFINEFYKNADRRIIAKIKDYLETFSNTAKIKPVDVKCNECKKAFQVEITFDHAHFFA